MTTQPCGCSTPALRRFTVSMTRIGYAHRDIEVEASSEAEAREKAEEVAGNYVYSEHTSEYEVQAVTDAG